MSTISLVSSRPKTKRKAVKYFHPEVVGKPVIINREELRKTILKVLGITITINCDFLVMRGKTSKENRRHSRNPGDCWRAVDFFTKEIIKEMEKFLQIMTTKRPDATLQNRTKKNTVAINRHVLASTTRKVLSDIQKMRVLSSVLPRATFETPSFAREKNPSKIWHLLDFLIDEINAEMGKLLIAMAK